MARNRVYPRVGGETALPGIVTDIARGLSPRGRGNRPVRHNSQRMARSIPAWAGKPPAVWTGGAWCRVYPRVGGETPNATFSVRSLSGLSPRGRGNRQQRMGRARQAGSIPAWAGKPALVSVHACCPAVYPRVGGETVAAVGDGRQRPGLSPRGRGNLTTYRPRTNFQRSIPAWAGKPAMSCSMAMPKWVYPRVGGETDPAVWEAANPGGLSPRGRGNLDEANLQALCRRSIPAWAGKPASPPARSTTTTVYPRVGGETLEQVIRQPCAAGLSPRGRGNRQPVGALPQVSRSIPAWAGKPPSSG